MPAGSLLLAQLGHFYEAFDDGADILAEKGFTITERRGRKMAGVPYHMLESTVATLRADGLKVGIIRQVKFKAGNPTRRELTEFA